MDEAMDMSQFMQGLLLQTLDQRRRIPRQAIPLIFQAMVRHDGNASVELCFAKHKGENRNEEVVWNDGEQFPVGRAPGMLLVHRQRPMLFEVKQNLCGVVLTAGTIVELIKFDGAFTNIDGDTEGFPETGDEFLHQPAVRIAKR